MIAKFGKSTSVKRGMCCVIKPAFDDTQLVGLGTAPGYSRRSTTIIIINSSDDFAISDLMLLSTMILLHCIKHGGIKKNAQKCFRTFFRS